jgi:hypothetical protein
VIIGHEPFSVIFLNVSAISFLKGGIFPTAKYVNHSSFVEIHVSINLSSWANSSSQN